MHDDSHSIVPDLKYNFHDSLLKSIQIGPRSEVTLHIMLYSIYYAGAPTVQVRFGAITNLDTVSAFFEKLVNGEGAEGHIRVDALRYDKHKTSKVGKLFFYVALDGEGEIKIHCSKLNVTDIKH